MSPMWAELERWIFDPFGFESRGGAGGSQGDKAEGDKAEGNKAEGDKAEGDKAEGGKADDDEPKPNL
jgi:hypothetical protein